MNEGTVTLAHIRPQQVDGDFMASVVSLLAYDLHQYGGRIINGGGYISYKAGPNIAGPRNKVVEQFLRTESEWLFMVDSDMVLSPDTLERLISAADPVDRPIVGGLCFGSKDGPDGHAEYFPTLYRFTPDGDSMRYQEWPDDQLFEVDGTGAACLLLHRDVLEKIGADNPEPFRWFQETVVKGRAWSEDMTFCLRAKIAGFPIFVHTGVQVGHVKERTVTADTYLKWRASEVMEPRFVITGTGRSGSGFIAQALTAAGIRTGHEQWFNPFNRKSGSLVGESSWCAVPFLDDYDGRVGLQLRHPLKVLGSLMNGDLFGEGADRESLYYRFKADHVDFTGDDLRDAALFIVEWLERSEERADMVWRLEDLDADLLVEIVDAMLDVEMPVDVAEQALALVPGSYNKHPHTLRLSWDDLPAGDPFDRLRVLSERLGYE